MFQASHATYQQPPPCRLQLTANSFLSLSSLTDVQRTDCVSAVARKIPHKLIGQKPRLSPRYLITTNISQQSLRLQVIPFNTNCWLSARAKGQLPLGLPILQAMSGYSTQISATK